MTDLAAARGTLIQSEDVDFRSAVSEAVMGSMGGKVNFHAVYQHNRRNWLVNGNVSLANGLTAVDGVFALFKNIEITGYFISLKQTGTAGTTTIDVHEILANGTDNGSIWTVQPSITSAAADGSFSMVEYFLGSENILGTGIPAGHTKGTFPTRLFSAGSSLRFDTDSTADSSQDLTFTLIYRPMD